MIKDYLKRWLKSSSAAHTIIALLINLYLRFAYFTMQWEYKFAQEYGADEFNNASGTIFAMWHNNLAMAPYAFRKHKNTYALVSPHSDGKIIATILKLFGHKIISGSTNKNAVSALRQMINHLKDGDNVAITPDGPRGPVYKVNSSITKIAHITKSRIIPVAFRASKYFCIKSWDKLMIPLPFCKGTVVIGSLSMHATQPISDETLERAINSVNNISL